MSISIASPPLREIVFFLVHESLREIGITRLMKLVFLADVEHVQQYGERLCDIDWTWYNFGPFSPGVYDAVESLGAEGIVHDLLMTDDRAITPSDVPGVTHASTLEPRHRYSLRRVLARYGSLSLAEIEKVVDATETMREFEPGGRLSVSREPRRSLSESTPALSSLLERTSEPDTRSWGNPDESAAEDRAILKEFSAQPVTPVATHSRPNHVLWRRRNGCWSFPEPAPYAAPAPPRSPAPTSAPRS